MSDTVEASPSILISICKADGGMCSLYRCGYGLREGTSLAQENGGLPDTEVWHFSAAARFAVLEAPQDPRNPKAVTQAAGNSSWQGRSLLHRSVAQMPFLRQTGCPWNRPFGTRRPHCAFLYRLLQKSNAIETANLPHWSILNSNAFSIHNWKTFSEN